jgi:hypothetical protein
VLENGHAAVVFIPALHAMIRNVAAQEALSVAHVDRAFQPKRTDPQPLQSWWWPLLHSEMNLW